MVAAGVVCRKPAIELGSVKPETVARKSVAGYLAGTPAAQD
jgi:hypothetical protein